MTRSLKAVVAAVALVLALPMLVFADEIVNDLDTSVDGALETMSLSFEGQATTIRVRVTNDDGRNGCNFGGRGNPSLVIEPISDDTAVATVAPSSLTFDSCGEHQQLQITAVGEGSTRITFQQLSNTTQGSFNLETGAFTVNVSRPRTAAPSPTATGVPTVAVASDPLLAIATVEPPSSTSTPERATATPTGSTVVIGGGGGGTTSGTGGTNGFGPAPSPAQTPELGSLVLFGAGAAGMAGYVVARLRSRRR